MRPFLASLLKDAVSVLEEALKARRSPSRVKEMRPRVRWEERNESKEVMRGSLAS